MKHSVYTLLGLLKGIVEDCYHSNKTTNYMAFAIAKLFPVETHVEFIQTSVNILKIEAYKDQNIAYTFIVKCDDWNDVVSKSTVEYANKIGNGPLLKK